VGKESPETLVWEARLEQDLYRENATPDVSHYPLLCWLKAGKPALGRESEKWGYRKPRYDVALLLN
jgi:hypothetical protein